MVTCDQKSPKISFTAINEMLNDHPERAFELVKKQGNEFYSVTNLPVVSLKELIDWQSNNGALFSTQIVANIILQVAEGLRTLCDVGCLHGNLSTDNILLFNINGKPTVQKIDIRESSDGQMSLMCQNDILIQPPEFFNDHIYDNKGDVWQLGLLFYELITFNGLFTVKTQQ